MQNNIYIYIAIMVIVTTLIRVIPLTLIRKEITNRTLRSFLYYIPYVTLAVMTFPAILDATGSPISAWAALIVAIAAQKEKELSKTFANLERIWEEYDVYEKRVDG